MLTASRKKLIDELIVSELSVGSRKLGVIVEAASKTIPESGRFGGIREQIANRLVALRKKGTVRCSGSVWHIVDYNIPRVWIGGPRHAGYWLLMSTGCWVMCPREQDSMLEMGDVFVPSLAKDPHTIDLARFAELETCRDIDW